DRKAISGLNDDGFMCPECRDFVSLVNAQEHDVKCSAKKLSLKASEGRQPLSKPVFSLMKDTQLKRYLIDYGIPSNADRQCQADIKQTRNLKKGSLTL